MKKADQNRHFLLNFFSAVSGHNKTKTELSRYIDDPILIKTLCLMEKHLPRFQLSVDEITAENNRVIVQARVKGILETTQKAIEILFVIGCRIENDKIVNHWFMADELSLMKQIDQLSKNNLITPTT